jgi:hypothetical protein
MNLDIHLGIVMANTTDQEKNFGIEVRADTLLPGENYPELFYPIFPANMAKAPDPGQIVEIFVMDDIDDEPGVADLGTSDFGDFCYYTGRIFDDQDGKIPNDLKTNYPKRAGIFWDSDGTIIYYDATKNSKQFLIGLTDRQTYLELKEDSVTIQHKTVKIEMKSGKLIITDSATDIGAENATHPLLLGDIVKGAFSDGAGGGLAILGQAAALALGSAPPDPTGAAAKTFGTSMHTAWTAFLATLGAWESQKHKADQ